MIRSPGRIDSSPRGTSTRSPRMMLATFESAGIVASLSCRPTTWSKASVVAPAEGTSNSTICTWPSAKTSVCFAAGTPIVCETARAVSSSDETMKSTSIWRSCQASRYSGFDVRTIVCVSRELLHERRGDEIDLVAGGAGDHQCRPVDARLLEHPPRGAVSLHRPHVVAVRDGLQPGGVQVDDRDLVVFVQGLDDGCADLPGAEHDDLHGLREPTRTPQSGSPSIPTASATRLT